MCLLFLILPPYNLHPLLCISDLEYWVLNVVIQVGVDPETYDALEAVAAKQGKSLPHVASEALQRGLVAS